MAEGRCGSARDGRSARRRAFAFRMEVPAPPGELGFDDELLPPPPPDVMLFDGGEDDADVEIELDAR